jgi:UDP-N-acetylmuramate dehydrogenase
MSSLQIPQLIRPAQTLATYTSFKVGGKAEFFAAPRDLDQLDQTLDWATDQNLAITYLGAGSNLLISDRGLSGLVICTKYLRGISFDPENGQVKAMAGESVVSLARQVAAKGWAGLEWAIGIPGSVGGIVVMNAGAQGGCMADCLVQTEVRSLGGSLGAKNIAALKLSDLNYQYRSSNLQNSGNLVISATIQLIPDQDPVQILARTTSYLKHRQATQPYHLPSCGSVFRNPDSQTKPQSAGQLIEATGLKGFQLGKAQVAELHANFILNQGGATATDIFNLICHIQAEVEQKWGVKLEPEVKMLGEFG